MLEYSYNVPFSALQYCAVAVLDTGIPLAVYYRCSALPLRQYAVAVRIYIPLQNTVAVTSRYTTVAVEYCDSHVTAYSIAILLAYVQ